MAGARLITLAKRMVDRAAPGAAAGWQRYKLRRRLAARRIPLPNLPRSSQPPVVLFFAPDAALAPHFVTHLVVARTLKELGHAVLIVRCFRHLLPRCVVMESVALPTAAPLEERVRHCESCVRNSLAMAEEYGLDVVDLDQVIDGKLRARAQSAMAGAQDLGTFAFAGVALGQFARGDLSRMLKINDPAGAGEETRARLRQYIETAALSYLAMERLCERLNVSRVVYFNDYAMTLAAAAAAEQKGIPTTHLSHAPITNNDRRRITMLSGYAPLEGQRRLQTWCSWRDLALPSDRVTLLSDDSFLRFAGSGFTIYSPAWTASSAALFDRLSLERGRRLLVAYTSSEDEVRGVRYYESALGVAIYPGSSPFDDQFDWLESLIDYVERSDDLQLVVRIHPREAPNRRENRTSENLREYQRRFTGPYRNVRIVWPNDPISSYDLAELADIGLIALSTIGFELARLGVPVIASFPHLAEAPEGVFISWDNTRAAYFEALRQALGEPPALDRVVAAFRWVNARFVEYSVDFGDVIPAPDYPSLPPFMMPRQATAVEQVLIGGRSLADVNRERLEAAQDRGSAAREQEAIARHLRSFLHFLLLAQRPDNDFPLAIDFDGEEAAMASSVGCRAIVRGNEVRFTGPHGTATKFSPMAARLARLAAQATAPAGATAEA
jgi:hypothetical protein